MTVPFKRPAVSPPLAIIRNADPDTGRAIVTFLLDGVPTNEMVTDLDADTTAMAAIAQLQSDTAAQVAQMQQAADDALRALAAQQVQTRLDALSATPAPVDS